MVKSIWRVVNEMYTISPREWLLLAAQPLILLFMGWMAFIYGNPVFWVAFAAILVFNIVLATIILHLHRSYRFGEDIQMGPIEFFGLVASLIEIANAARTLTPAQLASVYREEVQAGRAVAVPEVELAVASASVLDAFDTAPDFINRIQKRCLEKYQDSVRDADMDEQELYEVRVRTRKCVCENIKLARDDKQGEFPDGPFRYWWRQFDCQFF